MQNLDLKKPVGWMFFLLGGVLSVYGLAANTLSQFAFGANLNLIWGGILFVFGSVLLLVSRNR